MCKLWIYQSSQAYPQKLSTERVDNCLQFDLQKNRCPLIFMKHPFHIMSITKCFPSDVRHSLWETKSINALPNLRGVAGYVD